MCIVFMTRKKFDNFYKWIKILMHFQLRKWIFFNRPIIFKAHESPLIIITQAKHFQRNIRVKNYFSGKSPVTWQIYLTFFFLFVPSSLNIQRARTIIINDCERIKKKKITSDKLLKNTTAIAVGPERSYTSIIIEFRPTSNRIVFIIPQLSRNITVEIIEHGVCG